MSDLTKEEQKDVAAQAMEAIKDKMVEETHEAMGAEDDADKNDDNPFAEADANEDDGNESGETGFEAIDAKEEDEKEVSDTDDDSDSVGDEIAEGDDDNSAEGDDEQTIGQDLLFRAAKAGLTLEETQAFQTPTALEAAIGLASKNTDASEDDTGGDDTIDPATGAVKPLGEYKEMSFDVPEDLDEEDAAIFKGMADQFNAQMKSQHDAFSERIKGFNDAYQNVQGANERHQQEANLKFAQQFDDKIVNLSSDWEEIVGKGSMEGLADDSGFVKNRTTIFKELLSQQQVHPDWDENKLFDAAVAITFPEQSKRSTVNSAKETARKHTQSRSTARPSKQKKATPGKTRENAKKGLFSGLKKAFGR